MIGRIGVALQSLADRLADMLWQHPCLHADETPVRQLDSGSGKTRTVYLWDYRSGFMNEGPPIGVFDYETSRAGELGRVFLIPTAFSSCQLLLGNPGSVMLRRAAVT